MSRSYERPMTHQEYLKLKYSSQNDYDDNVKRKKLKKSSSSKFVKKPTVCLIDEDIDLKKIKQQYDSDEEELYFGTKEDKPIVTDVIDERPMHMRTDTMNGKWKAIGSSDNNEDSNNNDDISQQSSSSSSASSKRKTLSGKKAGLSDAKEFKKELQELKKKNEKFLNELSDDVLGKNAKTIFRDRKTGNIREIEKELEEKRKKDEQDAIRMAEKQSVYDRWSKGIVQREEQLEKMENDLNEMSKPLARYKDDDDLDQLLKNQDREDDPMLKEIRKKREKELRNDPNYKQYPKYKGSTPAPLNRFNIQPGYRWDGVDRSNGYEQKYFNKQSERQSIQEEAYRWSVQDM